MGTCDTERIDRQHIVRNTVGVYSGVWEVYMDV